MRHFIMRACAAILMPLALLMGPVQAAPDTARRPITHEDLWLMQRMGALAASPDGRWLVAAVAEPSYDEDKKRSDLWIMSVDGSSAPRRLTSSRSSEGDPAWSPDSTRIAFSAKREDDEAAQIYVIDLSGGEAQRVTSWPGGAKVPQFSPDGRSILYWDRWLDELRPSVIVQALDGVSPARDLIANSALRKQPGFGGRFENEGETIDATWTPDGRGVIFAATANRQEGARAPVFASLWQVGLDGGEPRRLTADKDDYAAPEFT